MGSLFRITVKSLLRFANLACNVYSPSIWREGKSRLDTMFHDGEGRTAMKPKYSALDIANYFLFRADQEGQELLSNLKLQKLVYYAQGIHLAMHSVPIFNDRIEAWEYGPVVPFLYHNYKTHGAGGIPADGDFDPSFIDGDTLDFLDEIFDGFGQFSAIRLMQISHKDKCWEETDVGMEISHSSMAKCLKKYLKDG